MFRKILIGIFVAMLVVAVGTAAYQVTGVDAAGSYPEKGGPGNGGTGIGTGTGTGPGTNVAAIPASDLNAAEAASLLYMREEEKLARDVYTKLYEIWGLSTFQNIAASEQTHMDQIALLLTRYNLTDPAQAPGVFTDPALQNLYTTLVAQGSQSLAAALKVGGAIEEIDILDLQTRLAQTDNADLQQVYTSLMNGSYNHLSAFARGLTNQTGETYVLQSLTQEQYQNLPSSWAGNPGGRSGGMGGGNGQGGGNH